MSKFEPRYIPEGLGHAPEKLRNCVVPLGLLVEHSNKLLTLAAAGELDDDEFSDAIVEDLVSTILSCELTLKYFDEDFVAEKLGEAVDRLREGQKRADDAEAASKIIEIIERFIGKLEEA